MSSDNIGLNKAAIIERCIRRMREEYGADRTLSVPTHLDALVLNIERACQAAIDLAMHIVAKEHLGMPQSKLVGLFCRDVACNVLFVDLLTEKVGRK